MTDHHRAVEIGSRSGSKPLRVLYAACGLVFRRGCGPSEHMLALAREMGKRSDLAVTVLFAHLDDNPPPGPYCLESLNDPGRALPAGRETDSLVLGLNPVRYFSHRRKVLLYAAKAATRFDVAVERMWGFGGTLANALQKRGLPVLLEENGPITWQGGNRSLSDWLRRCYLDLSRARLRKIYKRHRTVIVQTHNLAGRMQKEFQLARDQLQVVANGVALDRFDPTWPPAASAPTETVLVYSGTLDEDHDLRPLIRAVLQSKTRLGLRILGSGPLREELELLARQSEPSPVRFFGRVSPAEVARHLREADLCVAPYRLQSHGSHGFQYSPLKLAEYAAAGRAVAVADIPPSDGPIAPEINGFFLPNNVSAWQTLLDTLPDRTVLRQMGQCGIERVKTAGWDRAAREYQRLIQAAHAGLKVAPLPYHNPGNQYIDRLHAHLTKAGVELTDAGNLTFRWLFANRGRVDLIHLHWPESHFLFPGHLYSICKWLYLAARLETARRLGYTLVWTVHNLKAHAGKHPRLDRWLRGYLTKYGKTIFLGKNGADLLKKEIGVAPTLPFAMIRHGHYLGGYGPMVSKEQARKTLGLPQETKIFLHLGAIRPYKGVADLMKTFSGLDRADARLIIAGRVARQDLEERLRSLARSDADRILFQPGFIPDQRLGILLCASDYVVLPYRGIHMSGTQVLAQSYGRAVIAPNLGLISEYMPEGGGICYDPTRPNALADSLRLACTRDAREMGRRAREAAAALSWEPIAKAHQRFYHSSLHGSSSGAVRMPIREEEGVDSQRPLSV